MNNKLLVICTVLCTVFFTGCVDEANQVGVTYTGEQKVRIICIDEVEYVTIRVGANRGYMSAHFKPDGSLYTCEGR